MSQGTAITALLLIFACIPIIPSVSLSFGVPHFALGSFKNEFHGGTMLFVGDIMLARHVETLMSEHGLTYPFQETESLLQYADVTVGNFEAAIPERHVPTPNFTFRFSVPTTSLGVLKKVGFDVLSLANNHALDFGEAGYRNTQTACMEHGLLCMGHPTTLLPYGYTHVPVGDTSIGVLFIHATGNTVPSEDQLKDMSRLARTTSDIQIAYIHWGTEYESVHNAAQEELAYLLIDQGIDGVIGHHPHVVQDIGFYNGKPIFYSLGNFVFDQYFSLEVQQGMGVLLDVTEDAVTFVPVPFSAVEKESQPRLMAIEERTAFFDSIFHTESVSARMQIPKITIPR